MNILKAVPIAMLLALAMITLPGPAQLQAAETVMTQDDVRPDFPKPYVVKKGDTLWDIANHFFKDPWKWLKIWERNLYITNPDLIYPGNEIWFDPSRLAQGGLTTVRPQPAIVSGPVERLEPAADNSQLLSALLRQDLIQPDAVEGVGHILGGQDERLNYGIHDMVYLSLNGSAAAGDAFDIFRTSDVMHDPATGKPVGVLVTHLGRVRIDSQENGVYRASVTEAFEEISRGDRLKPARDIDPNIVPVAAAAGASGHIMYIRNANSEAGQNQVCGITLGSSDGLKSGMMMGIFRPGRLISDPVTGKPVQLPDERVGDMIVLVPQAHASLAMITGSNASINIGDRVAGGSSPR